MVSKNSGLTITFKDISYAVDVGTAKKPNVRRILSDLSGVFKPGRFTAIMGASGAGKTSLLNVLAGEATVGSLDGSFHVNADEITGAGMKSVSGFVFQDDMILPTMTVRESITMSATLRLPQSVSLAQKIVKVNETIELLGLGKCADTIVGSASVKGISGGERKRTAIAMELITDPSVLFLDEPTTGLDTYTAYSVIKILSDIAHLTNRTIIATIHQPSSEIFHMMDDLFLLAEGRVIYSGTAEDSTQYFAEHGYSCPETANPADYLFMDILNNEDGSSTYEVEGKEITETNNERLKRLLLVWPKSPEGVAAHKATENLPISHVEKKDFKTMSSFRVQFSYLFKRAGKNAFRNPRILRAKGIQTAFTALLLGLLYLNNNHNPEQVAVQNLAGVFFFLAINSIFNNATENLSIFGQEKSVFGTYDSNFSSRTWKWVLLSICVLLFETCGRVTLSNYPPMDSGHRHLLYGWSVRRRDCVLYSSRRKLPCVNMRFYDGSMSRLLIS